MLHSNAITFENTTMAGIDRRFLNISIAKKNGGGVFFGGFNIAYRGQPRMTIEPQKCPVPPLGAVPRNVVQRQTAQRSEKENHHFSVSASFFQI